MVPSEHSRDMTKWVKHESDSFKHAQTVSEKDLQQLVFEKASESETKMPQIKEAIAINSPMQKFTSHIVGGSQTTKARKTVQIELLPTE
mmetsp:Transcript_39957/g.52263  ORF Transcript_39957/g.52263 Transcript_39957/m.52263 type:complete len:89 (+) Transcript_39957:370-636(+)